MEKLKRLDFIDVCKFLGISLVVLGHMKMPNEVLQWIYAFHMPLFFVLSGYTSRVQKLDKTFMLKKIRTIYIPFLLFALIFCRGDKFVSWAYIFYGSRSSLVMASTNSVLWFLTCLFMAGIMFSFLMNVVKKFKYKPWVIVIEIVAILVVAKVCAVIKEIYPIVSNYGYPLNFDVALVGVVFMVAGYYIRQVIDWFNSQRQWLLIVAVVVLFAVTSFTAFMNLPKSLNPSSDHVEMAVGIYGNWDLFFLNALLMSMALIGLSVLVDKWVNKKKLLLFIGQNSLTILCVHGVLLLAASKVLPKIGLVGVDDMSLVLQGIVSYVIVIAASIPVILLIKRFVPNLVGK